MAHHGDLHTLRGQSPSPSPRSASTSLQATAAVNAGLQYEESSRKSSTVTPDFIILLLFPYTGY